MWLGTYKQFSLVKFFVLFLLLLLLKQERLGEEDKKRFNEIEDRGDRLKSGPIGLWTQYSII